MVSLSMESLHLGLVLTAPFCMATPILRQTENPTAAAHLRHYCLNHLESGRGGFGMKVLGVNVSTCRVGVTPRPSPDTD